MITRVLSQPRLVKLSKCARVYLDGQGIVIIRPTPLEILSWSPTLMSGQVSTFGQPWWLFPLADTWPDTWVDDQLHTLSSVGLIYVSSQGIRKIGNPLEKYNPTEKLENGLL